MPRPLRPCSGARLPGAPRAAVPAIVLALAVAAATASPDARAADCTTAAQSSCLDADALWTPAAPSRFLSIPSARALLDGHWSIGADVSYLSRPVTLRTGSPDPDGRTVRVVDDLVEAALSAAYVPVRRLELSVVVPGVIFRNGSGTGGVTDQRGGAPTPVLRDFRLGAGYGILSHVSAATAGSAPTFIDAMTRLDLAVPTGASGSFAGEAGPVLAPLVVASVRRGWFFASADLGARLRRPVQIGGVRYGSQIVSALGMGASVLEGGRLDLGLEAWVLPTPGQHERTLVNGTRISPTLTPAEWMFSARSRFDDLTFGAGVGGAIPFSSEKVNPLDEPESTNTFAGITSPRFRALIYVRYEGGR